VSREGLWTIISKFGSPHRFVKIVKLFHDGMMACVLDDGNASDRFQVTNGVKQGCFLAPKLFSLMFSAILADAFREISPGIPINYRCDRRIFDLEQEMQQEMNAFSSACDNFGFTISTKRTEVMSQPAPGNPYQDPNITVKGQRLQVVGTLTYIGSPLSRSPNIDAEFNTRIAKGSSAFGRLKKTAKQNQSLQSSRLNNTSLGL